jgi:hypothetical protein
MFKVIASSELLVLLLMAHGIYKLGPIRIPNVDLEIFHFFWGMGGLLLGWPLFVGAQNGNDGYMDSRVVPGTLGSSMDSIVFKVILQTKSFKKHIYCFINMVTFFWYPPPPLERS